MTTLCCQLQPRVYGCISIFRLSSLFFIRALDKLFTKKYYILRWYVGVVLQGTENAQEDIIHSDFLVRFPLGLKIVRTKLDNSGA